MRLVGLYTLCIFWISTVDCTPVFWGDGGSDGRLGGDTLLGLLTLRRGVGLARFIGEIVLCFTKKPRSIIPWQMVWLFW